jgi:transposase
MTSSGARTIMTRSEARTAKRKEVVEAIVIRGEPVALVARIYNIAARTVFAWLARYRGGGWEGLEEGARRGRPRKLSGEDMQWVYEAVTMGDPLSYKFEFCLWTLNIIRSMIARERGIKLSKSAVSRLLGHLGLSPQRPIYKSYKQDPKKIEEYLSETFPQVVERAREMGAEIYFVDEAAVRSDAHRGCTWGQVGETPVVRDSGGRFGLKVISAVTLRGDMRFSFIEGKMNSARFIEFLKKLRKDAGRPIIVIADNARYHHSKETQKFIEAEVDSIFMAFLPAYSPELNPDEQVWNHAKARLSKLPVLNAQGMKKCLVSILRSIQKQTSLIKSFFRLTDTKYIADIASAQ